jgi:transcriptional regulator with PAS, ATPase and Fis domain
MPIEEEPIMYQLLDLYQCQNDIRISKDDSWAILDKEDISFAGITRNGDIIYCNRAFLLEYHIDQKRLGHLNIHEILPDFWDLRYKTSTEMKIKKRKVINLWTDVSEKPFSHLIISFNKKTPGRSKIDLNTISSPNHPRFLKFYTGLYVANPEAYTLKVNPAYEKIAFLEESDLAGKNLRELEEKGIFSKSVTLAVLDKLNRGGAGSVTLFQKIITGKEVLVTGTPIYSEQRRLTYILTYVNDLISLATIIRKCVDYEEKHRTFRGLSQANTSAKKCASRDLEHPSLPMFDELPVIARDPLSISTMQRLVSAAKYESPILLTGETGVGKDLVAKFLHLLQCGGTHRPFVTINCSAIPGELLESELFGYEEGAFSGARRGGKPGLFVEAHGGVLFLNEISEMPLSLQAKLLSALDEGCIRPLGSSKTRQVKTRLIFATNKDLRKSIADGSFRSDLYYRINVLTVQLPPLRERPQDILPLVRHFMTRFAEEYGLKKHLSPAVQDILQKYEWPGNVRELRYLVERLMVFSSSEQIAICDLPPEILNEPFSGRQAVSRFEDGMSLKEAVRRYERILIEEALQKHGKIADAARMLSIDPTTLTRKLKKTD